MSTERIEHIDTRLVQGVAGVEIPHGATGMPIFQSTAFAYDTAEQLERVFSGRDAGFVYSRLQNPGLAHFEQRITALEQGAGSVACASGMAAVSVALLALAETGSEIVSSAGIFGGTHALMSQTLTRYGVRTRFVDIRDIDAVRAAINERTRCVFIETLGNPRLDVPDIEAIAAVAHEQGVALVVDSTATSPWMIQPGRLGADVVLHSTSKYVNGHGTAVGGVITDTGRFDWSLPRYPQLAELHGKFGAFAFLAMLRSELHRNLGVCLSPFNAFLMTMGMETLGLRMARHCSNALQVARALAHDPRVVDVRYPGLASHEDHALAKRQFADHYGGLLTFRLGTKARAFAFMNALARISILVNLGDVRTLVVHPASTFAREADADARAAMGVHEDLVRLSVGIEYAEDVIRDIDQALDAAG